MEVLEVVESTGLLGLFRLVSTLGDGCEESRLVALSLSGLLCGVWCCVLVLSEIEVFQIWVSVGLIA